MNIITAKYKLRKFIDEIMTEKALTNECISRCSKSILEGKTINSRWFIL